LVARLLASIVEELPASRLGELDDRTFAEVARLAPDIQPLRPELPPPPPLVDPGAKTSFFNALWEFLCGTLGGTLVRLEDLQWCDDASIDVLAHIARRLDELPALFVLTWRSEEVPRDSKLRRLLAEARKDGVLDHLVLRRLDAAEVTRIVEECLPQAAATAAELVYTESEGVPFFVAEYVELFASGAGADDVSLPDDALDIVRARLDPITGSARQVLAAASVLGRSFDLSLVQATAGRSEEETVDAIDELAERSVISEVGSAGEPVYDFTHEKIRAVVYDETSLARRRLLHGRAADFLTAPRSRTRLDDVSLAAYHSERAGRSEDAAELHVRAGDLARALFANAEAISHYERALALGHPDVGRLHEGIGDMEILLGAYERAIHSFETAAAYAAQGGIAMLERKLAEVRIRTGDNDLAREHLGVALDLTEPDDPLRAHLFADLGFALSDREPEEAAMVAKEAVATGERLAAPAAVAQGHNLLGLLARREGRLDEAVHHLSASLAAAEAADDVAATEAALNNLALARRRSAEWDEAVSLTRRALELCTRRGDVHRAAALHNNLADLLHEGGAEDESRAHAKEAARLFASVGEKAVSAPEIWKLTAW
jgi:tetratricopeptide (TPR) repeat protein